MNSNHIWVMWVGASPNALVPSISYMPTGRRTVTLTPCSDSRCDYTLAGTVVAITDCYFCGAGPSSQKLKIYIIGNSASYD